MQLLKRAILAIFQKGLRWPCAVVHTQLRLAHVIRAAVFLELGKECPLGLLLIQNGESVNTRQRGPGVVRD